ncbi:hypothetical protein ASE14_01720 [Agromyces sp. Root81]|nr:hypothetical protein ASE14_01720 [Agromyces sp. Root81]
MFDEFPAQVAYSVDMRFALLSPPEDEDPSVGYQLYVEPLADAEYDSAATISDVLISRISAQSDLVCWEVE